MSIVWILLGVVAVVALYVIATYNSLISMKNRVDEAAKDIDAQLKRRYELIPNLVSSVKGYAIHEKGTLEGVTEMRAGLMKGSTADKIAASNAMTETLKSLFAVAENYPDLKANTNFMQLQQELTDSQDKIIAAQKFYNANVRDFNTKIEVFPTNAYAKQLGFGKFEYIEVTDIEKANVEVKF